MVEEIGFVPVTADDVVSPGDSVNAKIDALIDRASVMVVELSNEWTRAEYDIALARNKGTDPRRPAERKLKIIVVASDFGQVPTSAHDFPIIRRTSLLAEDADAFVAELVMLLQEITGGRELDTHEPRRLLEAKEYRSAVISAMTLFEGWVGFDPYSIKGL